MQKKKRDKGGFSVLFNSLGGESDMVSRVGFKPITSEKKVKGLNAKLVNHSSLVLQKYIELSDYNVLSK